jgi:hypothetical protein
MERNVRRRDGREEGRVQGEFGSTKVVGKVVDPGEKTPECPQKGGEREGYWAPRVCRTDVCL